MRVRFADPRIDRRSPAHRDYGADDYAADIRRVILRNAALWTDWMIERERARALRSTREP